MTACTHNVGAGTRLRQKSIPTSDGLRGSGFRESERHAESRSTFSQTMWCRTPRAARSRRFIVSPAPFVLSDGGHENDALESLPRQHRDRFLRSIKILGN